MKNQTTPLKEKCDALVFVVIIVISLDLFVVYASAWYRRLQIPRVLQKMDQVVEDLWGDGYRYYTKR